MKRLALLFFFVLILMIVAAFPAAQVDARQAPSQAAALAQPAASPALEKTEISLAESPAWAQVVVVGVVGLFGWLAIMPLWALLRKKETVTS